VQNQGEISFTNEQFLALIEINKQQSLQIEMLTQQLAQSLRKWYSVPSMNAWSCLTLAS
jgi:hypothetical protein